jgi:signal transduction histidine kinase
MITVRNWIVYAMLAAIWAVLIGWQLDEHMRVDKKLHDSLIDRGRMTSTTCGNLLRIRRSISRESLEDALRALVLVDTNEIRAVQLLNRDDEQVASAGAPFDPPPSSEFEGGVSWNGDTVIMKNPVDLGTNIPELVMSREELRTIGSNQMAAATNPPPPPFEPGTNQGALGPPPEPPSGPPPPPGDQTNRPPRRRFPRLDLARERPSWMKPEDYEALLEKKGAHTFVVVLSAKPVLAAEHNDLWMRLVIGLLGTIGLAGYAAAWHSLVKNSELQLRLVRASEQNLHLKELNLAAAGLAHETRNPLNIIRGLAQLIVKHDGMPPDVAAKSREIINETDRVTAQLNEFINYSRPREVRRAATNLGNVANEVARALNFDLAEKKIKLEVLAESVVIEADEQLLRQALFNLVLNAVQAVPPEGVIRIRASRRSNEEAFIEISDNGPGVPAEHRNEIFKPYFTTHAEGTGLGLAVVQQIVMAHGWEIQCLPNEPVGALFRISHVKLKN